MGFLKAKIGIIFSAKSKEKIVTNLHTNGSSKCNDFYE